MDRKTSIEQPGAAGGRSSAGGRRDHTRSGKASPRPPAAGARALRGLQGVSGAGRALLAVAILSCVLYANTVTNRLVSDDAELIPNNSATHNPLDLREIFSGRYWGGLIQNDILYRPVTTWTLALNYGLNRALGLPGETPVGFHILNLLLNAAVCCLVYLFFASLRLHPWGALAGALLFATAPIHTEAVASIVGRSELLASLFGLLFLIRHREGRSPLLSGLFLLLALLSKESAAAFLILCIWADVCLPREGRPPRLAAYAAYAAAVVAWFGIRSAVIGGIRMVILKLDNPLIGVHARERFLTAASVQLDYLRLQLTGIGLSSDYSFDQIRVVSSLANPRVVLFVVLLAAAAAIGWMGRRKHRTAGLALGGYAILFLPAGNFLFPVGTIMAERLAYAPSILFYGLLAYGAWILKERLGRPVTILLGVWIAAFGVLTIARNHTWSDVGTFARAQLRSAPNSAKANYNMGTVEQGEGRLDAAADRFRRAIEILPEYAEALNNLGIVYKDKGDFDTAIEYYRKSIDLRPNSSRSLFNLGQAYHLKGKLDLAIEAYTSAIRLKPDYLQALSNLAAVYLVQGRTSEAEEIWTRCLRLNPRYEPARVNLERLRSARGR
jgi:protein O-mannosyl-transferase